MKGIEYRGLSRIEGPLVITARSRDVGFNELVAVYDRDGARRLGRVVEMSEDWTAVQI
jgi:V/A-type H+-transporting ATPase subunit B